jgi:hypothetical protein
MQDLDNNMDELFQKAGEQYPLKENISDWDNIAYILNNTTTPPQITKNKKNYRSKWLLLLISLLLTGTASIFFSDSNDQKREVTKLVRKNSFTQPKKETYDAVTIANNKKAFLKKVIQNTPLLYAEAGINGKTGYSKNKKNFRPLNYLHTSNHSKKLKPLPITITVNDNHSENNTTIDSNKNDNIQGSAPLAVSALPKANDIPDTINPITTSKNETPDKKNNKKGFYFGLSSGPQISQVKSQSINKIGFDVGIVAGYMIDSKVSIESGIFFSKKHYYSDGKYFSMDKIAATMPPNMNMISLNGSCTVFEIPLKLKYNFLQKNKHIFFGTAGVSSYILTKESNDYIALISGSQQHLKGNFQNTSKYISAAVNLSAGYEHSIKKTKVRLEPYIQMPLKGIGEGSMPVLSAGLHIGITLAHNQ